MEKNYNFKNKIEDTFEVLGSIEEVKVSADFSSRVLSSLEQEKNKSKQITWLTPQLQLAAMIVVLLVNAIVIYHTLNTNTMDNDVSDIEQFAKDYNIYSDSTDILN